MLKISGLNKTTLLDYPGRVAATVFLAGCNFRCPFCHNSSLVLGSDSIEQLPINDFWTFLDKRKNIIEGVCISGGEPTLYDDLSSFTDSIHAYDLKVKLDTNGYRPDVLNDLISNHKVDMVSMDIKGSQSMYPVMSGVKDFDISKIIRSADILLSSDVEFEFRTTVVDEYFDNTSFHDIGKWLSGNEKYFLQTFKPSESVIKRNLHAPSDERMLEYLQIIKTYIPDSHIRGEY